MRPPLEKSPQHRLCVRYLLPQLPCRVYTPEYLLLIPLHCPLHPQRHYLRQLVVLVHVLVVHPQLLVCLNEKLVSKSEFLVDSSNFFEFIGHGPELERLTGQLFPCDLEFSLQLYYLICGVYVPIIRLYLLSQFVFSFSH